MSEERREKEKELMRELILSAADEIAKKEGAEAISIRKIATKIDYTPSLVYHYFKDKEEIVNCIMKRNYGKIFQAISDTSITETDPRRKFSQMMKRYIETAISMSDAFIAAHMSKNLGTLKHTGFLDEGASNKKIALKALMDTINSLNPDGQTEKAELTAQLIAASAFGLIVKLSVENVNEGQKKRLIDCFSDEVILRMANLTKNNE
jgi:AcrR family transcriptional regulator